MPMKIAVVEDEKIYREQMVRFITNYAKENNENFEIFAFENGESFLASCKVRKYDIIFMDIILPKCDGLEISHKFRDEYQYSALVFVSHIGQYAINGYEVDALDFLVKPVTYKNFCLKMAHSLQHLSFRKSRGILLKATSGAVYKISSSDICYVESFAHYLEYHVFDVKANKVVTITVRGTISAAEKELDPKLVVRCHKSLLVNLLYVIKVEGGLVLVKDDNGSRCIPISRTYKADFMKKLFELYKA